MTRVETLDLNCDMGESLANWTIGDDVHVMREITTANVACGFHAGDPVTMMTTVALARENGVAVGAHPGVPDILGFGRRVMALTPEDVEAYIVYQVGALQAVLRSHGMELHHVKPHGAMYHILKDLNLAEAAIRGIEAVAPGARIYWPGPLGHEPFTQVALAAGVAVVAECYPDLDYDGDGSLVVERHKRPADPAVVRERVIRILTEQTLEARDGTVLPMNVESVCIHGDASNAVEVARAVSSAATACGARLAPASGSAALDG